MEKAKEEIFDAFASWRWSLDKRANFLAYIQCHPDLRRHPSPIAHGWELVNGYCRPVRHTKPALPMSLAVSSTQQDYYNSDSEEVQRPNLKLELKVILILMNHHNYELETSNELWIRLDTLHSFYTGTKLTILTLLILYLIYIALFWLKIVVTFYMHLNCKLIKYSLNFSIYWAICAIINHPITKIASKMNSLTTNWS